MSPRPHHQFVTRIFFIMFLFDFYLFVSAINFPIDLITYLFLYYSHRFYIRLKNGSFHQTLKTPFYLDLFS